MVDTNHENAYFEKFVLTVLVGEVSTSKAKGKAAGREKRKKGEMSSTAASTSSAPITPLGGCKGKRKRVCQSRISNYVCIHCCEKGHWKREWPKLFSNEVLDTNEFIICKWFANGDEE
ncbi:UNVERIFIED_CONTAM: hypothetical protein Sradi_6144300 [Sesamum radiatum]|uniref:Uncharacterized protein n=1 Tax=Sesamum radiatum TaxID=300843 RepID=A0AAW2KMT2_SESRA